MLSRQSYDVSIDEQNNLSKWPLAIDLVRFPLVSVEMGCSRKSRKMSEFAYMLIQMTPTLSPPCYFEAGHILHVVHGNVLVFHFRHFSVNPKAFIESWPSNTTDFLLL